MDNRQVNSISLKAMVDKGNSRVIIAELDEGLIDVVFSFLTMPLGSIIRLTRNQPAAVDIGCMNNLYESVENFDVQHLQTEACKPMLLCPRSAAETHCKRLKLNIDSGEPTRYFVCPNINSNRDSRCMLLSNYREAPCNCGGTMSQEINLFNGDREINLFNGVSKKLISAIRDGGVFVKGLSRFLITDDFQVMPPSTEACFSVLSKLGVMDESAIEERTFDVGVDEVLNLLKFSLVSKTPLTETLLKPKPVHPLSEKDFNQGNSIQSQRVPEASNEDGKICIKIMVSKSRNVVCYAEAGKDFVDLLFSFLTLPLGYVVKEMRGSSFKGCIDHLYTSVLDLDPEEYMKSDEHKALLVSPKVAPGFHYENQPLSIMKASHPPYYIGYHNGYGERLTTDKTLISFVKELTVVDPKSNYKEGTNGGGFVDGPAMFTVTDNLVITPISPLSGLSVLNKLKVPFNDVEKRVVRVGNEEASRLLVESFVSDSALTSVFIQRQPKQ